MIIVPLGVASATPTAKRHLSSVALWRDGKVFLFDCGENAQMRALQAGIKRSKIDYIFISHLDGDHFFGLPGLITTMQLQRRDTDLHIIGPEGLKEFIEAALTAAKIELSFNIHFTEIAEGFEHQVVLEDPDFYVEARPLEHQTLCVGYRFQEKDKPGKVDAKKATEMGISEDQQYKDLKAGKDVELADGTIVYSKDIVGESRKGHSFAYITDTLFCVNALKLAYKATILYHEATFDSTLKDKAEETFHSTAEDAATIAEKAEVDRLVITHFSARYTNQFVLLKEARRIFKNTWVATELRPIMTDPEHERGIIKPKVNIESESGSNRSQHRGGRGNYNRGRQQRGGGGNRYYRQRRGYDNRGGYDNRRGGGRNYDNRGGGRGGYDDRRGYDNRSGGGRGGYDNRGGGGRSYDNRGGRGGYDDRRGGYDNRRDDRYRDNRGDSRDRNYDNRGGGRDYGNQRRDWDSGRSDDRRRNYDRDRNPKDRDNDKDIDQSKLPVNPRNNFDDFDRF